MTKVLYIPTGELLTFMKNRYFLEENSSRYTVLWENSVAINNFKSVTEYMLCRSISSSFCLRNKIQHDLLLEEVEIIDG